MNTPDLKSSRITRHLLLCLLLALFTLNSSQADPLPIPPFQASYSIKRGGLTIGETQRRLTADEQGRYVFESHNRATGFAALFVRDEVRERSLLSYQDGGVRPLEYHYDREGGKKARQEDLHFDWAARQVSGGSGADAWTLTVPASALDPHVYQLQLMLDLIAQPRGLSYQIVDDQRLKSYPIEVIGQETLETKLGRFETVILQRKDRKRSTTLWCAEQLRYLPVQITHVEKDGSQYTAKIKALEGLGYTP